MFEYIIRRLLLMIPTFFGTTLLVFMILQSVPSGPFEQAVLQIKMAKMQSGENQAASTSDDKGGMELSEEVLDKLRMQYGLDKSVWTRYFIWLGIAKKEIKYKEAELGVPFRETIQDLGQGEYVPVSLQRWILAYEDDNGEIIILSSPVGTDFKWKNEEYPILPDAYDIADEDWVETNWEIKKRLDEEYVALVMTKRQGVLNGYLGESSKHNEDVGTLIWERLHISAFIGITSFIISYIVCIPLGIMKALRHGSKFDVISSAIVFIGYSIPAYAFGLIMLLIFSTTSVFDAPILPSRGWRPEDWEQLTLIGKFIGQMKHCILPMSCFMLASFAGLTVLMKNSLMENLSQDYVRTAFAKGLSEKRVILYHAVRNSLIPLATGIGGMIGVFLAGSYLIEKVFGIDGIGLLTFKAIGTRDYGIIMGFLVIGTIIRLVGNLISDLCYAIIDPRIRFK
ncbi:MAG: hypothetical protein CMG64_02260 [Candidatus Marinimicrobia bacterium]|nr:hypothetical protein [Candidatus Neomarinimicrobiota bacterium]